MNGDNTTASHKQLQSALIHLTNPNKAGHILLHSEFGVAGRNISEWTIIELSPSCRMRKFYKVMWWSTRLRLFHSYGLDLDSLTMTGFRDARPGEVVFADGAFVRSLVRGC